MNSPFTKGFAILPVVLGVVVTGLVGLSGYLAYSNITLRQQNTQAAQTTEEQTVASAGATTTDATADLVVDVKKDISAPAPTPKKVAPVAAAPASTAGGWAAFYDQMVKLEGQFLVDYEDVTLSFSGTSDLNFQKQANKDAAQAIVAVKAKVAEGKTKFPSQLACLNKEDEAMNKYKIVVDRSDLFLNYSTYLLKVDDLNTRIDEKLSVFLLRARSEDYDEAKTALDEVRPMITEAIASAQAANKIIPLDATTDYIKWRQNHQVGLAEIDTALKNHDYDSEPDTDFLAISEALSKAIDEWAEELDTWVVSNLKTAINEADKVYSDSNALCSRD